MTEETTAAETEEAPEETQEEREIARLAAKVDATKHPVQKASYKFQLDILTADDADEAARIRETYNAFKEKTAAPAEEADEEAA